MWALYISLTDLEAEPFDLAKVEDKDTRLEDNDEIEEDPLKQIYEDLSNSESDLADALLDKNGEDDNSESDLPYKVPARNEEVDNARKDLELMNRLKLEYTLVICYLSCLVLRVPILMKDLLECVASEEAHAT